MVDFIISIVVERIKAFHNIFTNPLSLNTKHKNAQKFIRFSNFGGNVLLKTINMMNLLPVALVVFSNDLDAHLSNIEIERKYIEEALEHYNDTNRLKVITRSSVTVNELFRLFNRYQGRIALFHFAGHASGHGLQLNDENFHIETGLAEGLADLFQREVEEGQLELVFLNGCSTQGQVESLEEAGIPSIIATNCAINDNKAIQFA